MLLVAGDIFDTGYPSTQSQDMFYRFKKKCEITGLMAATKFFELDKGFIITAEHDKELTLDNKKIIILPAYKIFIDKNLGDY